LISKKVLQEGGRKEEKEEKRKKRCGESRRREARGDKRINLKSREGRDGGRERGREGCAYPPISSRISVHKGLAILGPSRPRFFRITSLETWEGGGRDGGREGGREGGSGGGWGADEVKIPAVLDVPALVFSPPSLPPSLSLLPSLPLFLPSVFTWAGYHTLSCGGGRGREGGRDERQGD